MMRIERNTPIVFARDKYEVEKSPESWFDYIAEAVDFYKTNPRAKIEEIPSNIKAKLVTLSKYEDKFLEFVIGVLGAVKPIRSETIENKYSSRETIVNLKDPVIYRDREYTQFEVHQLLRFLRLVSWSTFTSKSQSAGGKYNSAVPLFMYAQKLYNSIPYEYWRDGDIDMYPSILGKGLTPLLDLSNDINCRKPTAVIIDPQTNSYYTSEKAMSRDNFWDIRIETLTGRGKHGAEVHNPTDNTANKTSDEEYNKLPKLYRFMIMQLWIFNVTIRNSNMILDWWDWDRVPTAIDTRDTIKFSSVKSSREDLEARSPF